MPISQLLTTLLDQVFQRRGRRGATLLGHREFGEHLIIDFHLGLDPIKFLVELVLHRQHQIVFVLQLLPQQSYLFLHGPLLVRQVPHAVVVILVLSLETGLAAATVDVVLVALGIHMNCIGFPWELLLAVRTSHNSFLTVEQMISQVFAWVFFITVHALHWSVKALFLNMLVNLIDAQYGFAALTLVLTWFL